MVDGAGSGLPTASVVVPTFNRRDGVRATVESVLADAAAGEIIVVVDGCRDGTMEMLVELASDEPRLRPLFTENSGAERARQTGAVAARGDVLVFLDDDVVAAPGLVSGHLRYHDARDRLVVLGYMPAELALLRRPGMFATALYAREYEATCQRWEQDPASILRSLWAGNFSIRRNDALEVGLATPAPLPYHEDMALGLRCLNVGLTGVFDRTLLAHHLHAPRSVETFVADARRQARGALALHHERACGPFPFADEEPFPPLVRRVIKWGASLRSRRMVQKFLRMGIAVAGRVHLFYIESYLAMVLRSSVQRETILTIESQRDAAG
ncbi:MAG: glycosyltransferase [Acidimicrobiales bacterium]